MFEHLVGLTKLVRAKSLSIADVSASLSTSLFGQGGLHGDIIITTDAAGA